MKVICNRGALLDALTVAGNVVATRTPKPVLQCVKLSAEGNELTLSGPREQVRAVLDFAAQSLQRPETAQTR